ncbi:MAG: hypothetical protein ACLT76_12625 [Clostridium fessum]
MRASEKMIRRHPHVFGKSMLSEQGEPVTDWDATKKQEKAGKSGRKRIFRERWKRRRNCSSGQKNGKASKNNI